MDESSITTPSGAQAHVFEDETAWTVALARTLTELARQTITARSVFSVCLTGGSTPRPLYEALSREPWRSALDWSRVLVFFGDERTVPPDHPDSNYRMAHEAWLGRGPIPAESIFRMEGEAGSDAKALAAAAGRYAETMRRHLPPGGNGFPVLDLLLLGMGGDGHTASLFPGTGALDEWLRPVVANHVPQLDTWRLTMTLPVLNTSRHVWFLATGEAEAGRVAQALGYREGGTDLPAARVKPAQAPHWWLDRTAAAFIATG